MGNLLKLRSLSEVAIQWMDRWLDIFAIPRQLNCALEYIAILIDNNEIREMLTGRIHAAGYADEHHRAIPIAGGAIIG